MAVPSSGTLSLWGLAKEKTHDNYSNGVPIATWQSNYFANVSLSDATTGAGNYDGTNQNSSSKPDGSAPHKMSEWYGYDHDASAPSGGGNGKCLLIIDHSFTSPGTQTGCTSSTAIAGATGGVNPGGGQNTPNLRFARYQNNTGQSVSYNLRVYRNDNTQCSFKVYKGAGIVSDSGYSTANQTLVHTHTSGYNTFTGSLNSTTELLFIFESVTPASQTRYASFDQFYVSGQCAASGTMLAVPILGSPSSTAYQYYDANTAWNAGNNQKFNSSSWSTAYIHQCAGSSWAIGNTIYQTNSTSGNEVAFNGTSWRVGAYPNSTWILNGYPGDSSAIIAFENDFNGSTDGNIEDTYQPPF
jgi:hypothetical protein